MFQGIDRFLATILGVITVIVLIAIILVWRSPAGRELEYSPGSNPEDVVQNFIVAVSKGDEARAKSYLSAEVLADIEKREDEGGFSLISPRSRNTDSGLRIAIEETSIEDGLATVRIEITRFHSATSPSGLLGIFDNNQYSYEIEVRLRQFDGAWQIVKPFDPYMIR